MNFKNNLLSYNSQSFKDLLIIIIPLITFLIYFYFNFLEVEDSNVFFNRANYLNSSFFYYFNGQIHFNAQILANTVSILPPLLQALFYGLYCLISFYIILILLGKIIEREYILLYVIYVCSFYTLLIYNVANSLWTAVLISYLIIYLIIQKKIEFNNYYFLMLLYFSSSSVASSVLLIPLIYLIFFSEYKIKFSIVLFWIVLTSFFIFPNWESDRTNIIYNLSQSINFLKNDFYFFFLPKFYLLSDIPSRLIEFSSFFGILLILFLKAKFRKLNFKDFIFISSGYGLIFLAFMGRINDNIFIGQRYYVIIIVLFIVYFKEFFRLKTKFLNILIILSILVWPATFLKRFINNIDNANKNFKALVIGFDSETYIKRSDQWAVYLTKKKYSENDCNVPGGKQNYDPSKDISNKTLFIYCSDKLGVIDK